MLLSRRQWLALCGTAVAAGTTPCLSEDRKQACTLGFSTYGMKSLSTERAVQALAEIGFDAVEIIVRDGWDADSAKLNSTRRQAIRRQLADSGLQLRSLMEHVYPNTADAQKNALHRLQLAADTAHALAPIKPPLIQTVLGPGRFEQQKNALRDRLGEWLELAIKSKVVIAIKPHRGGVVSKPSEAIWLLKQLGGPSRLKMVYDYSHYAFRDLPLKDTIAQSLPHTVHIAVKDAVQAGDRVVFQLPGESGTIDFAEIIRSFHRGGYRGDINCEVSGMVWGKAGYDPLAAARTCYRNVNKAFQAAGVARA